MCYVFYSVSNSLQFKTTKKMTAQVFKSIAFGVLAGLALFFAPFFLLRALVFFLIIGAVFRLFAGRRWGRGWHRGGFQAGYMDYIRNMSDEEYAAFKQQYGPRCYPNAHTVTPQPEAK